MTFSDFMKRMDIGLVSYHIYKNEWMTYGGDLPEVPRGYTLPLIKNDNNLDATFHYLKIRNKEIDTKYPKSVQESSFGASDYEAECFFVHLWLGSIFDYWFGKLEPIDNDEIACECDILGMCFWDYLRGEVSFEELKKSAQSVKDTYDKFANGGE